MVPDEGCAAWFRRGQQECGRFCANCCAKQSHPPTTLIPPPDFGNQAACAAIVHSAGCSKDVACSHQGLPQPRTASTGKNIASFVPKRAITIDRVNSAPPSIFA